LNNYIRLFSKASQCKISHYNARKRKTTILTDIPIKLELQQMEKKNKKLNIKRQFKKISNKTKNNFKKIKEI